LNYFAINLKASNLLQTWISSIFLKENPASLRTFRLLTKHLNAAYFAIGICADSINGCHAMFRFGQSRWAVLNTARGQGYTAPRLIGFTPVSLPKNR
jgi:hypothetical protein